MPSAKNSRRFALHTAVYERDGWLCRMPVCLSPHGRAISPSLRGKGVRWAPTVDHVRERGLGGNSTLENLRAAHRLCNEEAARWRDQPKARKPKVQPKKRKPPKVRYPPPFTYQIGEVFPGDQGSRW